ncbi:MAG TPA: hypothetical protein VFB85_19015 [Vicinamibacterales bacterium]|nr:hypothetical protein [Vicinamibacterales bacterium]
MPAFAGDDFKGRKKDLKRLQDSTRSLDGWEQYRALVDASEEAYDLIDISNREARFALIVMGALNAVPFIFLTRGDAIAALSRNERIAMAVVFSGYAILLMFFILQAIEALHPGWFKPEISSWSNDRLDHPAGVRHFEEIIERTASEHWVAWQNVRLTQLNAELAVQIHSLARKNHAKHLAVRRLYLGLRAMAVMLGALLLLFGIFSWL